MKKEGRRRSKYGKGAPQRRELRRYANRCNRKMKGIGSSRKARK
jgi:hypothetical protein